MPKSCVPVFEIIPIAGARPDNASLAGVGQIVNDHVELLGQWGDRRPRGDVLAAQNPTSDGFSDSEKNEPTAMPTGRSPALPVMTVTPVGKCPSTLRNSATGTPSVYGDGLTDSSLTAAIPR